MWTQWCLDRMLAPLSLSQATRALAGVPCFDRGGVVQDRQAAVALAKRAPASPKARRRSLKATAATPHTEPLMAARRAERELKGRIRQVEEECAAARAAAAEERSRSSALREGIRRAQEMRRAAERQRDDAVAAAQAEHKSVAALRARVKTLQASFEQVRAASCTAHRYRAGVFGFVYICDLILDPFVICDLLQPVGPCWAVGPRFQVLAW